MGDHTTGTAGPKGADAATDMAPARTAGAVVPPAPRPLSRLEAWLERPIGGTVTTILILLTGGWASIRTADIQCCIPFQWRLTLGGVLFWLLAAASGYLFFVGQRAKDAVRRSRDADHERVRSEQRAAADTSQAEILATLRGREEALRVRLDELGKIMRTMPPENFIESYSVLYLGAASLTDEALRLDPNVSRPEIVAILRRLLSTVATLAKTFDGDHKDRRYASNIMAFRAASVLRANPELCQEIERSEFFFREQGVAVSELNGVLSVEREFSATADSAEADADVPEVVLPIPQRVTTDDEKYLVLPGAGVAFVDRTDILIPDTSKIPDLCREHCDLRNELIERLRRYFAEQLSVGSFASLVLLPPDGWASEPKPTPLGIVNVHANEVGLLRGSDRAFAQFVSILRPILRQVAKLWQHLHTTVPERERSGGAPGERTTFAEQRVAQGGAPDHALRSGEIHL